MTSPTIAPLPTKAAGITQTEKIPADQANQPVEAWFYSIAVGFSEVTEGIYEIGELEEPIEYYPAVDVLRRAGRVEEHDFPVGSPFGA